MSNQTNQTTTIGPPGLSSISGTITTTITNAGTGGYYSYNPNNYSLISNSTLTNNSWNVTRPYVAKHDVTVSFQIDDGTFIDFPRAELIKYICDQPLREENEVVRKLWERYEVAVKLVRSKDNGDHGS